ncbi:hypothetical protein I4U23_016144 [Adineta vaga]|nr:hypothetical protein I4U23_016144 [Adineta vaga]
MNPKLMLTNENIADEDFAERFYQVACNNPTATCIILDETFEGPSEYTYANIYKMVCQVQQELQVILVEPKGLIAICMERSVDTIVSVLACLLRRSPFLLIEPSTPMARINILLNDAKPLLLITDEQFSIARTELPASLIIRFYKDIQNQKHELDVIKPFETHSCNDIMYIIYTSGSTGQPKGVTVPYRAMYNRFRWMWKAYPWNSNDVQLWKTSSVFCDCIWEILGALLTGVPTVVASSTTVRDPCLLLQLIKRKAITRITLIPTMLSSLLKLLPAMSKSCIQSLRYVIVSGEALPKAVCKQFLALSSNAILLNLYGSTEIGNDAIYYEVRHVNDEYDTIPIGKPITNIYYKIVNDELWIAGDGLCHSYLNDVEKTAAKFVCDADGYRYFKTGDCVRECIHTGYLLFCGRIDNAQVKIRGARIELEEVEAICMQHPLVQECACFVHENKAQLIAIIYSTSSELFTNELRQWLSNQLPEFEVPSVLVFVCMPLNRTASGKIDRKHLIITYEDWKEKNSTIPAIDILNNQGTQRIMNIWCKTLEISKINRLTFTELGGHSLLAIQLQCEIQLEFNIHVPIEQFFCHTTIDNLIEFINQSTPKQSISLPSENYCEKAPLTLTQKSIWIADELQNNLTTPVYTVTCAFEILSNDISNERIKEAISILIQRHDSLRTFVSRDLSGEMYQIVKTFDSEHFTISSKNIYQEITFEDIDEIDQILNQLSKQKFYLDQPQPLCRFYLYSNTKCRILAIVFHHLIIDGWSIDILTHDLETILTGQNLPPIIMQFCQYATIEHELCASAYDNDLIYWKKQLSNGALTATRLPHDHEPLSVDNSSIGRFIIGHYTQETDMIIGTPVANRTRSEIEHTIGMFTNILVLRMDLSTNPNFNDLLSQTKKTVLEAFAHQSLPFVSLLSALEHKQRDQYQNTFFQIILAYQNVGNKSRDILRKMTIHEQTAKFELDIQIWPEADGMLIEAYFRLDLFNTNTIERFLEHWLQLTRAALSKPITMTNEILSISSQESNRNFINKNLCQLFFEQVQRTPNAIAIEDKLIQLTYIDVWRNALHFSHIIQQHLKSSFKQCIAIRMKRGADLIQAILSVLLSANHFVYIDHALPRARQHFIIEDTHAHLMITDSLECQESIITIRYEVQQTTSIPCAMELMIDPTDLAYILYTSGSTGTPKGVCISHYAIAGRMINVNYHSIKLQTRVGQLSTFSFDMSIFEMFGTLLNGGILVIVSPESTCSIRALMELQLDIIGPSTAVFNILVQQESSEALFASLQKIYIGGEKANVKYLRRAMKDQTLGKFVNMYGPTETTVFALFYELSNSIPIDASTIPIGQSLTNTLIYIVDESLNLVPHGIPGELLIGGIGLSNGYHNRSDLTKQKFIDNPFGEGLVYCTGDICRMLNDGNIEFLRRLDTQVKLRSQRLELGEIEFHLLQHEYIADAVVLLRDDIVEDEKHLVAYIQPISSIDSEQIRHYLTKRLPDYMIPTYIVIMSQFSLNLVGKIDKKSLPKPQRQINTLDIIRQICSHVLKQNDIDMNENFFKLGGHSLSAMEIIAKIYEKLNIQITIPNLFQTQSIAELARYIEKQLKTENTSQKLEHPKVNNPSRAPLTATQKQFWFFWKLKPESSFYNVPIAFKINGKLNMAKLNRSLHYLVSKYVLLRTEFKEENDGTVWQEKNHQWNLPLIEETIEGTMQTPEVIQRLQFYSFKPFKLTEGQVCRFVVFHLSNNQHIFLICYHHIICDGQSASQFVNELFELYDSNDTILPMISNKDTSFFNYAIHMAENSSSKHNLDQVINYLRDFQSLTFNPHFINEQKQDIDYKSHISTFVIPTNIAEKLRKLAINHSCTLHTILLALFNCILSVYCSDTSDIILGSIISTRSQPGVINLFGPLINTLPIRTHLPNTSNTTFLDILQSVRQSVLFSMEHQMVPFADIVQRLRSISTDPSLFTYHPIVRVIFEMNSYNLFDRSKQFMDGTEWTSINDSQLLLPYTKSDINLEVMDYGINQPIRVAFYLDCNLFKSEIATVMADCYRYAIDLVVRDSTCTRTKLWDYLHMIQQNRFDLILHEQFRKQTYTYVELLEQVERIASYLCHMNTKPGDIIALYMNRCAFMISAMFGVLMAGATYLYLDPELPDQRIRSMLRNVNVRIVIENEEGSTTNCSAFENMKILSNKLVAEELKEDIQFPIIHPSHHCYLIYTSGSTGEPKGMMIQHQAVSKRIRLPVPITSSARIAQLTSCSFDAYILEIYGALLHGATLIIYDKKLIFQPKLLFDQITEQHITHMYLATPIFNLLAEYVPNIFANMECVLFAGDSANAKLMRIVLQTNKPPKRLINAYGPTETTCIVTWYDTSIHFPNLSDDSQIPIGLPLSDTPLYIVNPTTLELVGKNEEGELIIGGYGVCDGYINNHHETKTKFLVNQYGMDGRIYRTGDRVKRSSDGTIQFLGRFDTQVKINGNRIELAEIEYLLQGYPTISEAIVVVRNDLVPNTQSIVAYVRPKEQNEKEILQYLSRRLPSYMLPSFIIPIEEFPISSGGGKRDIKSLPSIKANIKNEKDTLSIIESKLQLAWNTVLNNGKNNHVFQMDDDFFMFGGTSMNIIQLHRQLEIQFGLTLDPMSFFEIRTLSAQLSWFASLQPKHVERIQENPLSNNITTEGISIIGMSARYGTIETAADLWTALRNGTDFCTHITNEELLQQNPSMASMLNANPNYVHAHCPMTNALCFDHVFFGMTKRDAEITDPQHRILLEATYEALENAGIVPQEYSGTIGMFGAIYRNTYADQYNLLRANPYEVYDTTKASMGIATFDSATIMRAEIGNMIDGAPTFVSYKLGFNGPSMAIQTACSSSGTAIHMAIRSLEAGDCSIAIVAGISITFPLDMGYNYQPGMVMSKTGICRSFDESADGVVGGDGAGVVVLMKTSEAISTGYSIRGKITGYAINNDGQNKKSYSTTSPDAQAMCMQKAQMTANIHSPQQEIDYVEAHGPGTQMGDLLEIQALTKAYSSQNESITRQLYLGSIKTNIGHTAHSACMAGLIKIVLSLEAAEIPPTLNFHQFSPVVQRLQPPFQVNTHTIPWPTNDNKHRPRRAALNTLGQGGTNTHFIIEQGYSMPEVHASFEPQLFVLSAKTETALTNVKLRLFNHLSKSDDVHLLNASYTLACGRIAYDRRYFAVASTVEELKEQLSNTNMSLDNNNSEKTKPQIIFVFPGQGTQYAGMARQLYDRFPQSCAKIIDTCLDELHALDNDIQQKVRTCLFNEFFNDHVVLEQYAQITLFIVEYSLAQVFLSLNIRPHYIIGHSSGEFVAACLAEVMTMKDAIRLLVRRCQLMMTVASGAMLAVEIDPKDDMSELAIEYDVDLAVINSSTQYVYSGSVSNIQKLETDMRNKGKKVKLLNTFTGFHSRLMEPICQQLEYEFKTMTLREPTIPIISTVTGQLVNAGEMTQTKYWCDHLRQPVLFAPCLFYMLTNNLMTNNRSTIFIPVGPGKALHSLLIRAVSMATVISSPLSPNSSSALFYTLGSIWANMIPLNWTEYYRNTNARRTVLPNYPFERTICDADNRATTITDTSIESSIQTRSCCTAHNLPANLSTKKTTTKDLFELLSKQNKFLCERTQSHQNRKNTLPWKINKRPSISVQLLNLLTNTSTSLQTTPTIRENMQLNLGSCSSLFVLALYHEAIELDLLQSHDLVTQFIPNEYQQSNLTLTIDDLLQNNIETNMKCCAPDDLLNALQQITMKSKTKTDRTPTIFALSLLGHILAVLHETSYDELVYDRIILPFNLQQTKINISLSNEAYYPATATQSCIEDLQMIFNSSNNDSISTGFKKALLSNQVYYTNTEQLIILNYPNNSDKVFIIASQHPLQQSNVDAIIKSRHSSIDKNVCQSFTNYEELVHKCLTQLLGSSGHTMISNFSSGTLFDQLGIDSLQAITFVELLSQQFGIQLSVDLMSKYPNIKSLSDYLKQFFSIDNNDKVKQSFQEYILNKEAGMPRVYESTTTNRSLSILLSFITNNKVKLLKQLHQDGALLFRGFAVDSAEDFSKVVELLADKDKAFLDYKDGISPRTRITNKVFTSTEYPQQFDMALHNEMSYSHTMPSMIFFYCQLPPDESAGGETPIGNSAAIYNAIDPSIRQDFIDKQLLYITNLPSKTNGISLGKTWQDTYQTESKADVETFLKDRDIQFKWLADDRLRTIRLIDGVRQHPDTGEMVWCNHAHLFHPTDLNISTRQTLQKRLEPLDMPKNCFFGNGDIIPDTSLDHIRQVLKQHEIKWTWKTGDILILDNLRTAHGRASFHGERRILVSMC